jgi:CheY-like chemotaxis protein
MKHSESVPAKANGGSPLPRFLRGLFRGRETTVGKACSTPAENTPEHVATEVSPRLLVQPVAGRRPKVLVVDDDAVVLKALELKLSKAGCDVITGQDGSQAVTTARKEQPDLIVLDVNFPPDVALAWDGIGVMQWLQRLDSDNTPPAFIISGMANDQVRERALEAGAAAFFQKPVDCDALVSAINKTLAVRRVRD